MYGLRKLPVKVEYTVGGIANDFCGVRATEENDPPIEVRNLEYATRVLTEGHYQL